MTKTGIIGGASLAAIIAATVLYYQPSHASDTLLAQAQSEFTAKARDEVAQRFVQRSLTTEQVSTTQISDSASTQVATIEPTVSSASATDVASAPTPVTAAAPIAPVVATEVPASKAPVVAEVETTTPATQPTTHSVEPIATQEATIQADATPATDTAQSPKATQKPVQTTAKKPAGTRTARRDVSNGSLPYGTEAAIRAHAPEIAAAIRRYM